MCRLLGVISKSSVNASWLRQFKNLAQVGQTRQNDGSGHKDGWGIVCYIEGKPQYIGREPTDANTDVKYDVAVRALESGAIRTGIAVAHVRKMSKDSSRALENTHPFIHGNWAFCHNGDITGFSPALQLPLEGSTDSERFFKYLIPSCLRNLDKAPQVCLLDSIKDAKKLMKEYTALNFVASDGKSLFAYRDFNTEKIAGSHLTLKYCRTGGMVAVCSEPLTAEIRADDWEDIKNGEMLVVDRDLDITKLMI